MLGIESPGLPPIPDGGVPELDTEPEPTQPEEPQTVKLTPEVLQFSQLSVGESATVFVSAELSGGELDAVLDASGPFSVPKTFHLVSGANWIPVTFSPGVGGSFVELLHLVTPTQALTMQLRGEALIRNPGFCTPELEGMACGEPTGCGLPQCVNGKCIPVANVPEGTACTTPCGSAASCHQGYCEADVSVPAVIATLAERPGNPSTSSCEPASRGTTDGSDRFLVSRYTEPGRVASDAIDVDGTVRSYPGVDFTWARAGRALAWENGRYSSRGPWSDEAPVPLPTDLDIVEVTARTVFRQIYNGVAAIDLETGTENWRMTGYLVTADGSRDVFWTPSKVVTLDEVSGSIVLAIPTDDQFGGAAWSRDTFLLRTMKVGCDVSCPHRYAAYSAEGTLLWEHELPEEVRWTDALTVHDGILFAQDGRRLRVKDGEELPRLPVDLVEGYRWFSGQTAYSRPVTPGVNPLCAFSLETGAQQWCESDVPFRRGLVSSGGSQRAMGYVVEDRFEGTYVCLRSGQRTLLDLHLRAPYSARATFGTSRFLLTTTRTDELTGACVEQTRVFASPE